ncbi:MAG: glycosyltransferase [Methanosarcinales archaeon]
MGEQKWIIIAGEEAGPKSNKMGGIWNVIDAEATNLALLIASGKIREAIHDIKIIVAGPYYGYSGADWNAGLNRITDLKGFQKLEGNKLLKATIDSLQRYGISIKTGSRKIGNIDIGYLLFDTSKYDSITTYYNKEMVLTNKVKQEAYELVGLDSLVYEKMANGIEYTHYLNLSHAISKFIQILITLSKEINDHRIRVCLHCHEFGVFYAIARLKKLGIPLRSVATFHATVPGRSAGYRSIDKIISNDNSWDIGTPINLANLESLSRYADTVTFVGESIRKEALLFYGIDGIVVRNGIELSRQEVDWEKKKKCRELIQIFLSDNIYKLFDGEKIDPKNIIPIFTISRIELENKGYPDLLDALVVQDRVIRSCILSGILPEEVKVICFLVTAHGPKNPDKIPQGFPVNLPTELLIGEELKLKKMIANRQLQCQDLISGRRVVAAILYPQWIGKNDGGLNLTPDEFMAGCVAGVFPSRYDPFLLTGLEAGKEGTPSIVSKVCGFSDALKKIKRLVPVGMGGVVVVDNIDLPRCETIADYALAMDYFTRTYIQDKVKYNLLCEEAFLLAKAMSWEDPVKQYYEILTCRRE